MAKASAPVWTLEVARISAEAICAPEAGALCAVIWSGAEEITTLGRDGMLRRWSAGGALLCERALGAFLGRASLWSLSAELLLVQRDAVASPAEGPSGSVTQVVAREGLEVVATLPDASGPVVGARGRIFRFEMGGELVCYAMEGCVAVERSRRALWARPRPFEDHWVVSADGGWAGVSNAQGAHVVGLEDGTLRALPAPHRLLTIEAGGASGLVQRGAEGCALCALSDGQAMGALLGGQRAASYGARVAGGWLLADDRGVVWRVDEAGALVWRRGFSAHVHTFVGSPDGGRVAVGLSQRVIVLDVRTGEVVGADGPSHPLSVLGFVEEPAQVVGRGYCAEHDLSSEPGWARGAYRWSGSGELIGGAAPQGGVVAGGALYGQGWADPAAGVGPQLERHALTSPASAPQVLGACRKVWRGVVRVGGQLFYDVYVAGGWELRRAGLVGGVWEDAQVASYKRSMAGSHVEGSEAAALCAVNTGHGEVRIYEEDGRQRYLLTGVGKNCAALAFSPDGAWLVATSDAKAICWSMATGEERWQVKLGKGQGANLAAAHPSGEQVVLCDARTGALRVYAAQTGVLVATVELGASCEVKALGFGADGRLYMTCGDTQLRAARWPSA